MKWVVPQSAQALAESIDNRGKNEADKLLDQLLKKAVRMRAASVHIEPFTTSTVVRYRIDGKLIVATSVSKHLHLPLTQAIKQRAALSNTTLQAQNTSYTATYDKIPYIIDVTVIPTTIGEKTVLTLHRVLSPLSLQTLGFWGTSLMNIGDLIAKQRGLILITGGADSGSALTITALQGLVAHSSISLASIGESGSAGSALSVSSAIKLAEKQHADIITIADIPTKTAFLAALDAAEHTLVIGVITAPTTLALLGRATQWVKSTNPAKLAQLLLAVIEQQRVAALCSTCKVSYNPSEKVLAAASKHIPNSSQLLSQYQEELGKQRSAPQPHKPHKGGCKTCNKTSTDGLLLLQQVTLSSTKLQHAFLADKPSVSDLRSAILAVDATDIAADRYVKAMSGIIAWR